MLTDDHRLLVFYAGKTLIAYRRAAQAHPATGAARSAAQQALETFARWVVSEALQTPARRNVAVALWVIGEAEAGANGEPVVRFNSRTINLLLEHYISRSMGVRPRSPATMKTALLPMSNCRHS